jgi:hypothetical protein
MRIEYKMLMFDAPKPFLFRAMVILRTNIPSIRVRQNCETDWHSGTILNQIAHSYLHIDSWPMMAAISLRAQISIIPGHSSCQPI